ncbi:MAG: hypothetical protein GX318_03750 [Clostridia bacterium]|nr:hypothetical protein [Clostridia bacterium]
MNLYGIREAYSSRLKSNISANIELYKKDEPWISDYFKDDNWFINTGLSMNVVELLKPYKNNLYDLENTRLIYDALMHLKVSQAIDERIWVYLTHETFWGYMRKRWPMENKKNPAKFIKDRYFLASNNDRALIRNGISRLWWYGHITYDSERVDKYGLTKILLSKQDIAANLLERSFSRNKNITHAVLSVLEDNEKAGKPLPDREHFRQLMKQINLLGGFSVLDALESGELKELLSKALGDAV